MSDVTDLLVMDRSKSKICYRFVNLTDLTSNTFEGLTKRAKKNCLGPFRSDVESSIC